MISVDVDVAVAVDIVSITVRLLLCGISSPEDRFQKNSAVVIAVMLVDLFLGPSWPITETWVVIFCCIFSSYNAEEIIVVRGGFNDEGSRCSDGGNESRFYRCQLHVDFL